MDSNTASLQVNYNTSNKSITITELQNFNYNVTAKAQLHRFIKEGYVYHYISFRHALGEFMHSCYQGWAQTLPHRNSVTITAFKKSVVITL